MWLCRLGVAVFACAGSFVSISMIGLLVDFLATFLTAAAFLLGPVLVGGGVWKFA